MHACNGEQRKRSACSEIAIFVKHAVVRKQLLVVGAVQFSVGCNGGGIGKRSTCPIDKSKDSHTTLRCCNDVAHRLLVFGHEPRFQHQVFRWVTGNGKFGKDHNVAVGFVCRGVHLQDSARITSNIAHNGVQLGQSHPHVLSRYRHDFRLGVYNFTKRSHLGNGGEIPVNETESVPEFGVMARILNRKEMTCHIKRNTSGSTAISQLQCCVQKPRFLRTA